MKLDINSTNPGTLKNDIITLIESEELKTWETHSDSEEKYLKHIGQWGEKGVIKLTAKNIEKKLEVEVLKFKSTKEDVKDFEGYYLGRFCELIFVNFPNRFTSIDKK